MHTQVETDWFANESVSTLVDRWPGVAGVVCNPMDLAYRVQDTPPQEASSLFREAADPSVVLFRDHYYLFASMSGGLWHSSDLVTWDFLATPVIPYADYAPDVREIDGALVVCESKTEGPCHFYRSRDPLAGDWEIIPGTMTFWDPNLFQDEDGRVYLYYGCSSSEPIRGVELDRHSLRPLGEPVALVRAAVERRGWERTAENWDTSGELPPPYIEGAWMTKHGGRYYLQYAAPGTELNTYGDGCVVSEAPLGPFEYSSASPISSLPGGFITGAGHGSTLQDRHGNWWHFATLRISVAHIFERRIGMFPASFEDGHLVVDQVLGDHPIRIPAGPADAHELRTGWVVLGVDQPTTASGAAEGHPPEYATAEDIRTCWVAPNGEQGHWVMVELPVGSSVHAVQVNLAEHAMTRPPRTPAADDAPRTERLLRDAPVSYLLEGSTDGQFWQVIADTRERPTARSHVLHQLATAQPFRWVRVTGGQQAFGGWFAVSGLRVFGVQDVAAPGAVTVRRAERMGPLDGVVAWDPCDDATFFVVRYGTAPTSLTHAWMLRGCTSLAIGSLNAGSDYWVAVDAGNGGGLTVGAPMRLGALSPGR